MSDEPVNKKPKTVSSKRFQFQWYDDNPSWKIWVKDVPNDPTKFFCKAYRTTLICGLSEIKKTFFERKSCTKHEKIKFR